jgi:acyl carrier protein
MGLDLVELVIEVEKAFDINILNADAEKIITVGQLYDYVVAKLPAQETDRCLSAAAFYRFRRALTVQFGIDRRAVHPSTLIAGTVLEPKRRSDWRLLEQRLDWRLPSLVRPAWMSVALMGLLAGWILAVIAASGWAGGIAVGGLLVACASVFGAILLSLTAFHLTTPFATRFPGDCSTVRGMVRSALLLNYGKLSTEGPGWNRQEVWDCLRAIIVKQLGVPPDRVVESAELVKDFGAD